MTLRYNQAPAKQSHASLTAGTLPQHDLDVLIALAPVPLTIELRAAAKYGVWSCYSHASSCAENVCQGVSEVVHAARVTDCYLRRFDADGEAGVLMSRCYVASDSWSVSRSQSTYYWKTSNLFIRELKRLYDNGQSVARAQVGDMNVPRPVSKERVEKAVPTSSHPTGFIRHISRRTRSALWRLVYREQWALMYRLGKRCSLEPSDYKLIAPPKDRIWADPYPVFRNARYYIFFEELVLKTGKGHISRVELDRSGFCGEPVKIIDQPYHLSYPFLFEWSGSLYMIPESKANQSIEVYECVDFPDRWKKYKTLLANISAVDATLLFFNDIWWLFANVAAHKGATTWDELYIFYADNPLTDCWQPHAGNPVVCDGRRARPAGGIWVTDGVPYRPSQDCSLGYGYAVRINRIDKLTTGEYKESTVDSITPATDDRISGIHTFNRTGELTMMDARLNRPRWF